MFNCSPSMHKVGHHIVQHDVRSHCKGCQPTALLIVPHPQLAAYLLRA